MQQSIDKQGNNYEPFSHAQYSGVRHLMGSQNHLASPLLRHEDVRTESQDLRNEQGMEEVDASSHAGPSMPQVLSHYPAGRLKIFVFMT